ncbi:MAG: 4Fe-4S binding protein [Candidatus Bathyarchaeota archaeon]|nr:4Fe-4S binding protein [Candidatus Bathyarchaeota archaeon]
MKVALRIKTENVTDPIISTVILEKKARINILSAQINEKGGKVLLEVPDEKTEEIVKAFRDFGVDVEVGKIIEILKDKCMECGHCITLCPVDAIFFEKDYAIGLDENKCIQCRACLDCCPTRAIKLYG